MIEPGTVGGLLLILGAFALYKGNLMLSVGLYAIADIMWAILAYRQNDTFGMVCVLIGLTLGLGVFLKSHRGEFVRNLHKDKK